MKETEVPLLLSQILDELRAIRSLLERQYGVSVENEPAQTAVCEVRETPSASMKPVYTPAHAEVYLKRYLTGRRVKIVDAMDVKPENAVIRERMHLGYFMGRHYAIVRPLLQELRATLQRPRKICLDLSNKTSEELCVLTSVADRLFKLYMLDFYRYNREERVMSLRVRRQPFVHNYLSGGWFEYYVAQASQKLLGNRSLLALRNVKLEAEGGAVCEVDLLLVTEYREELSLAVVECKSADTLYAEDARQIRRRNSLLNLGMQRSAVVMPEEPSPEFAERWLSETGAQVIGCTQLEAFLRSL